MKYKKILLYTAVLGTVICSTSCVKDIGNYDYLPKESVLPIKIVKIDDVTAQLGSVFELTPTIENLTDESKYSFLWYLLPTGNSGSIPVRDTISRSKNLSATITQVPNSYNLYFEVRDIKTDLYVNQKIPFTVVATPINAGWYILKDINDETDFDYINKEGAMIPNVLKTYAPTKLPKGQAVKIAYQSSNYYHQELDAEGVLKTLNNQRVFQILSTKDIKTFEARTLRHFKDYEDQFYGNIPTCNPQNCDVGTFTGAFLVNNGKVHGYGKMSMGIGKFGAPYIPTTPTYALHSDMIVNFFSICIGFDTINRSFVSFSSGGPYLSVFSDKAESVPSSKMDYRLISMLRQGDIISNGEPTGLAIMQKDTPSDKNYYFINLQITGSGASAYPFTTQPELIPATAKMPKAQVRTASTNGMVVYFGSDNVLHNYTHATATVEREKLIHTFPAGEKIASIKEITRPVVVDVYPGGLDLVVITNSPQGWKLYVFNVLAPGEIEATPRLQYEGTGTARDFLFRNV